MLEALRMAVPQNDSPPSCPWDPTQAVNGDVWVASATMYWYLLSKKEMRARVASSRRAASWARAVRAMSGDVEREVGGGGLVESMITALLMRDEPYLGRTFG